MVAELLATMRNLWSDQKVTAAQLLGEDDGEDDDITDWNDELRQVEEAQDADDEERAAGWLDRLGLVDDIDVADLDGDA